MGSRLHSQRSSPGSEPGAYARIVRRGNGVRQNWGSCCLSGFWVPGDKQRGYSKLALTQVRGWGPLWSSPHEQYFFLALLLAHQLPWFDFCKVLISRLPPVVATPFIVFCHLPCITWTCGPELDISKCPWKTGTASGWGPDTGADIEALRWAWAVLQVLGGKNRHLVGHQWASLAAWKCNLPGGASPKGLHCGQGSLGDSLSFSLLFLHSQGHLYTMLWKTSPWRTESFGQRRWRETIPLQESMNCPDSSIELSKAGIRRVKGKNFCKVIVGFTVSKSIRFSWFTLTRQKYKFTNYPEYFSSVTVEYYVDFVHMLSH
jgi:hypothetical protein